MKFSSEDLMKAMGLQVGDKVRIKCINGTIETYEIKQGAGDTYLQSIDDGFIDSLAYLIDQDYELLPRPKRVGDLKCKDFECAKCHLRCLPHCNQADSAKRTLFNILNGWNEYNSFDQEIYDLLKDRLDKEVK